MNLQEDNKATNMTYKQTVAYRPTGQAANQLMTWKSTSQLWCISLETVSPHLSWCLGQFSCFASLRHFGFDFFRLQVAAARTSITADSYNFPLSTWSVLGSVFGFILLFWVIWQLGIPNTQELERWSRQPVRAFTSDCTRRTRTITDDQQSDATRDWASVSLPPTRPTARLAMTDVNVEEIREIQW